MSSGNGAAGGADPTRRELETKRAAENVAHKAEEQARPASRGFQLKEQQWTASMHADLATACLV